ncbi:MAG: DeoR/GlpR transcriptional regulator [Clostridia bacterium]|nr:DeoR/GlpR transcriptional regulator [Clostridia bacterium]
MNRIRQERIRAYVESKNVATIKELKELLPNVSLMTIHRDLDSLERQGVLAKYRGGVKSIKHFEDVEFNVRLKENNPGKLLMAKKAMSLL